MHITSLHRYPIKSCRGHAVTELPFDRLGPVGDRRLMLVDGNGRFLSQREIAAMATVVPYLEGETLRAEAPGLSRLDLRLLGEGTIRSVTVWGSEGLQAVDQGDEAAAWFSSAIDHNCRLVRFGSMTRNPISARYSPRADAETAFTDGYPVMATTEASLADLNRRLEQPVPMARFRPTLVVGGAEPWAEDGWQHVRMGGMELDGVKPCARCVITTTDQESGVRHTTQEPLRTLKQFRMQEGFGAIFGQNMVPCAPGVLRVGDEVMAT